MSSSNASPTTPRFIFDREAGGDNCPLFTLPAGEGCYHTMIFGCSGRGRSVLLESLAAQQGLTVEELERRHAPTPEQQDAARRRQEDEVQREARRLAAVCQAYWDSTSEDEGDLGILSDVLAIGLDIEEPTRDQQKALLLMLPANVVGQGIAWGFSDTEVRESLYEFVEEHREEVLARVLAVAGQDE